MIVKVHEIKKPNYTQAEIVLGAIRKNEVLKRTREEEIKSITITKKALLLTYLNDNGKCFTQVKTINCPTARVLYESKDSRTLTEARKIAYNLQDLENEKDIAMDIAQDLHYPASCLLAIDTAKNSIQIDRALKTARTA